MVYGGYVTSAEEGGVAAGHAGLVLDDVEGAVGLHGGAVAGAGQEGGATYGVHWPQGQAQPRAVPLLGGRVSPATCYNYTCIVLFD